MTNKKKQVEEGSNFRVFAFAFEDNLKCTVNHIGVAPEANCNLKTVKKKILSWDLDSGLQILHIGTVG